MDSFSAFSLLSEDLSKNKVCTPWSETNPVFNISKTVHDEVHTVEKKPLMIAPSIATTPRSGSCLFSPTRGDVLSFPDELLSEAVRNKISEYDLAAYHKDEFTRSMERNLMKRVYDVFDVQQKCEINIDALKQLCDYLGYPLIPPEEEEEANRNGKKAIAHDLPKLTSKGGIDFDSFWKWWLDRRQDTSRGIKAFALASAHFSVPFHQQQLFSKEIGEKYTLNYRIFFYFQDQETTKTICISPWHDIPLYINDLVRTLPSEIIENRFNFVCEIPKWTRAKYEINTKEPYNPIRQDITNGVPRFYKHGDMMWNYGAFPQTWESTEILFEENVKGDNDPLDALEIGMSQLKTGSVTCVKVLGILGMIDNGEMDWKVITIDVADPLAKFMNNIDDVPKYMPGCLDAFREWMRVYKICQGDPENRFAFNGEFRDRDFAIKVIANSHLMWGNLLKVKKTTYFVDAKK